MTDTERNAAFLAVEAFERAVYPGGVPTLGNAWLGIYQTLMWYEHGVPHIIDADKLRSQTIWRERAQRVAVDLAEKLGCEPEDVEGLCDQLMKSPAYLGAQRQNPLGKAFIALVRHVLETVAQPPTMCREEVDARTIWPGIQIPGRSTSPRIDILTMKEDKPFAIVSVKWSLRHDRLGDITNECPVYKAAASWLRQPLAYYVVTNEFDPARLGKVLNDPCVDKVIHVHKRLVTEVSGLDGRLDTLADLSDLPVLLS